MNPILIRHLYGSVRRNRFFWLLSLYLLGIGLLALFFVAIASMPIFTQDTTISMLDLFTGGRSLYWFSGIVLILTAALLVPVAALGALSGERENRTLDVLKMTTLPTHSIVLGKLTSALLTGAVYVLAPFPLLMTGFWLGGVTGAELVITLLFLILTMIVKIAWALFLSSLVRKTIGAVILFYGLTFASMPVILILATALAGVADAWKYSSTVDLQPLWIETLIQYGWVLLSGLHPLTAAGVSEALGMQQGSWFLLNFTVERYNAGAAGTSTFLGTVTLPAPWITYAVFSIIVSIVLLKLTMWRLNRPER